jgi:heme-degrading monooxygenase HmoA
VSGHAQITAIGLRQIDEEARMALARVVTFDGVSKERMDQLAREMQEGERPEGLPATEVIALHDADAEKSLVIVFFDNEDDYRQGDATLSAMPTGDTPGQRTSVSKYDVAIRMTP